MHLVLRSTKARGRWSFRRSDSKIKALVLKFTAKHGIKLHQYANAGNHLHLHIQLPSARVYKPFIRAVTSAIAMAVMGVSRWRKLEPSNRGKFWDHRPFTRIVFGRSAFLRLQEYIEINQLEGLGWRRDQAKQLIAEHKDRHAFSGSG
jgi:REP element-mobilizing transposase RayT